jgi:tetratricopeptide (TPR) repeat protein
MLLGGILYPQPVISKSPVKEKNIDETLVLIFKDFRASCKNGDLKKALNSLKEMRTWELDKGFRNVPFLSEALIRTFENSPLDLHTSRQQRLSAYRGICRLSPDEPCYRWQYFKSYFFAHPFDAYNHFKNFGEIIPAVKTNMEWTLDVAGEILLAFIAALFLTAFGMAINFIIKYSFYLVFYLKQFVRVKINNLVAILLIAVVFLLPIYFNIGFLWLPLFWMVLMWLILTKSEKGVVFLLLIIVSLASFGLKQVGRFYLAGANKSTFLLYQANYNQVEPTGHAHLKKLMTTSKGDAEILFTLGLLAKRSGNYNEAVTYYQWALKAEPSFSECMNNLGNAYLLMNKGEDSVEKARYWYKKAIEIDHTRAEYFYNLSKSFPLLQVEGMEYVVKARDLNPRLIDELTKRDSKHPNQKLEDCLLSYRRLWRRAFSPWEPSQIMSTVFWKFFLSTPMNSVYAMPIFIILIIIAFSLIQKRIGMAVPCARCGQLFFRRIPVHFRQRLCQQCQMIQQRVDKVDPDLVKQKENEIASYRMRRKVTAYLLGILPFGGSFIVEGGAFTFLGLCVSFLFFWFLSYFLICHQVFPGLATLFFGYAGCSCVFLVIAILIYLLSLSRMIVRVVKEGY